MTREEIKQKVMKLMVNRVYEEFAESEEYEAILLSDIEDKDAVIILEVYDRIWEGLFEERLRSFVKKVKTIDDLMDEIVHLSRDIKSFETQLYMLANRTEDGSLTDEAMNAYAGLVPNTNMEILETIEGVVLCKN
jgi:aromatic ring hydroxylase